MKIIKTKFPGVLILEPKVFPDDRGYFLETWNVKRYEQAGVTGPFVQDNISFSKKGILRGLHFQYPQSQGKLIQVLSGEVLSETNHRQIYVPLGFAQGYCVTSKTALFSYKCTDFYNTVTEHGIIWNDPDIGIEWLIADPILSAKDKSYLRLKDLRPENLP